MMCKQETALEMLKTQKNKGGLTSGAIKLAEAQCQDYKKMEDRMTSLEKKVDLVEKKVDTVDSKIDKVLEALEREKSWKNNLKAIVSNKVFQVLVITVIGYLLGKEMGLASMEFLK